MIFPDVVIALLTRHSGSVRVDPVWIVAFVRFEIRTTLERRKRTSHVGEIILNTSKLVNYPNQNGIRLTVSTKTVDPV